MKKIVRVFVMIFACIFAVFGCDCNKKETAEERLIRLYDINANAVIDDWERPYRFNGEYNGVEYSSRGYVVEDQIVDNITTVSTNDEVDSLIDRYITDTNKSATANRVIRFTGGLFFNLTNDEKILLHYYDPACAYIVDIYSANDLIAFAKAMLTTAHSTKYIAELQNDIDFRTTLDGRDATSMLQEVELLNFNGASLYGKGHIIEGFKVSANNLEQYYSKTTGLEENNGKYDDVVNTSGYSYITLKYSLISNASSVYDVNIHMGLVDINIDPHEGNNANANQNLIIDVAPLRNVAVIDNVDARGYVEYASSVINSGQTSSNNTNVTVEKVNISMLEVDEDIANESNWQGEPFYPYDTSLSSDSRPDDAKYDYDLLISDTTQVQMEIYGKDDTIPEVPNDYTRITKRIGEQYYVFDYNAPQYEYAPKITNASISNVNTLLYVDYKEKAIREGILYDDEQELTKEQQDNEKVDKTEFYDACNNLNIAGLISNQSNHASTITKSTTNVVANLLSGGNVNFGGAIANVVSDCFVEEVSSNSSINFRSIGESVSAFGAIAATTSYNSQIKNCQGYIDAFKFVGHVDIDINYVRTSQDYRERLLNDDSKKSSLSVGGVVGLNFGYLISNTSQIDEVTISRAKLVAMGAIVGASTNGVIIKNISYAQANISDSVYVYSGTMAGNCFGGVISNCIAQYDVTITNENLTPSNYMGTDSTGTCLGSNPARISTGLVYFQSRAFESVHCGENSPVVKYDNFYHYADGDNKSDVIMDNKYAPKIAYCMVKDDTKLILDHDDDVNADSKDIMVNNIYIGRWVNLGGFYLYRFINTQESYDAVYNIRSYDSSYNINGRSAIDYKCNSESMRLDTLNFYGNSNNTDNTRISIIDQTFNMTLSFIRRNFILNGVTKNGINELELLGDSFKISNLRFNNIYSGSYLATKSIQMDKDLYADKVVDSYDEFQRIMANYIGEQVDINTSTASTNDIVLFDSKLIEKDDQDVKYKCLVISENEGVERYVIEDGEFKTEPMPIQSLLDDKLYFGKSSNSSVGIYAFNKDKLSKTALSGGTEQTNLPAGYDDLEEVDKSQYINPLTPIEILVLYNLTQMLGIERVAFSHGIVDSGSDSPYSIKTQFVAYFKDSNGGEQPHTFILDTMYDSSVEDNGRYLFYVVK